ncbi:UDP-glucose/GDP-mannose dehydrogenase family protein [Microbacterium aoyamense]|uniref:UDP-glucose 6-dehydrogenase n=1 Tax=Microbacterium aoyamense TaxID=344166 RepID=A0ABN2PWF5_9MICO|nr:UDP-glucose/GDP-mannose dehydrogenase family protein [Microbacterium aoyamense]
MSPHLRPAPVPIEDESPLRVSVIGTGYLGATHAAAVAEMGFTVIGVDTDPAKIAALEEGEVPFYEPGLPELIRKNIAAGRLSFTTDLGAAVAASDIHFICVGTPQQASSHAADLSFVEGATRAVAAALTHDGLIVGKSTVPVGTAQRLRDMVDAMVPTSLHVELDWNPEFLREGYAVEDTLRPDRIVIGGASPWAEGMLRRLYGPAIEAGAPVVTCDLPTAELVKVSANAFLATKISFINAIAEVCEKAGADVTTLADAIGYDARIGRRFLNAGLGFGGGCLPKDIRALTHRAGELGALQAVGLMQQVDEINMGQRQRVVELAMSTCPVNILNARVAVLGVAFKPDTDDVRDSPALNVAAALHLRGALVSVYDPEANATAKRSFPTLTYAASMEAAVTGADLVLVLTEWPEIAGADPEVLGRLVAHRAIVDARRCLPAQAWRDAGWHTATLGSAETEAPRARRVVAA